MEKPENWCIMEKTTGREERDVKRRLGAALLALAFALAVCCSVACLSAHIGHCCAGPACEQCPALLAYLRLFDDALPAAAGLALAFAGLAFAREGRGPRLVLARRTPVRDGVQLND